MRILPCRTAWTSWHGVLRAAASGFGPIRRGSSSRRACAALRTWSTCRRPANAPGESLVDTLPRFVDILRASHPLMPILVVAKPPQANDRFQTDNLARRMRMCEFQRQYVSERRRAGDRNLHFLEGEHLLGPEGVDGTVDGVHPTDLGFRRMAEAMAPVIRQCLAVAATDAPMA